MVLPKVNSERWLSLDNLDGEVWKDVPSLNNLYAVSNYGRLKSHSRHFVSKDGRRYNRTEKIVRLSLTKQGYCSFRPSVNGVLGQVRVHRLVAEAFIANPNGLPYVNHKDEVPYNNIAENLEWCTAKYNSNYGTCQERHSSTLRANIRSRLSTIKQYDMKGILVGEYVGKKEIEDAGYTYRTVRQCCNHHSLTANGYVWRENNDPFDMPVRKQNRGVRREVKCFDLSMNFIKTYKSMSEAGREVSGKTTGVNSILACCNGKFKSAYGYIWRYA